MRTINPKSNDKDSFMYLIIISLHYYDISCNPERLSNLRQYMNKYNFTDNTANGFEIHNPHVSLEIRDGDGHICSPSNTSNNKAVIVKLHDYRYATIKPIKNKYIRLKEILQLFSQKEISDIIMRKIIVDTIDSND